MGVPGLLVWLENKIKKLKLKNLINKSTNVKNKIMMLDTNCLLHPCVQDIITKYKNGSIIIDKSNNLRKELEILIWNKIKDYINDILEQTKCYELFIAIDGVVPCGKITQQRQRRSKYYYDTMIKLNSILNNNPKIDIDVDIQENGIHQPHIPITSIELTPGTEFMERLHLLFIDFVEELINRGIKTIYSSYHEEGEGEHKILQYIKTNYKFKDPIIIYGLDADLLFLALSIGENYDLHIMRESHIFNNKTLINLDLQHLAVDYSYINVNELHKLIALFDIETNDFILISYLIGNDFIPPLLTTDIKKGGMDRIIDAYNNVIKKLSLNIRDKNQHLKSVIVQNLNGKITVDHKLLIELFKELLWTEKYVWQNMNKKIHDSNEYNTHTKFLSGQSFNIDFLDKIEFNSDLEYLNHWLGTKSINIDKSSISSMVSQYIQGIEWCAQYYLATCISYSWSYNFLVAPLIKDIINLYPKTIKSFVQYPKLNPIEQLILAIPVSTYKYVISSDIINKLKNEIRIGYMFPDLFSIDVNKESVYWKTQVKIPHIEYETYIKTIRLLNI